MAWGRSDGWANVQMQAASAGMWGQRGYGDGSILYLWLSSIALLPWLSGFLHRHFPPQSPPSHPLRLSTVALALGLLLNLSSSSQPLRLLAALHPWVHMAAARTVWFSFHLGCHRSAVSVSALNVSPLTQTVALMWGSDPCFSSATHWGQV